MALNKTKVGMTRVPDVIKFYFEVKAQRGTVTYTCNKCSKSPVQRINTGYTNLSRHLGSCTGKYYVDKFTAAVKTQQNNLSFAVVDYVSERELVIFKWIKWLVMRDMPFSEVDNALTRELAGFDSSEHISSKSVTTYIKLIVPLVEQLIAAGLPDSFAIMFDGWKHGTTHYVAVFAVFMQDEQCMEVLLGFSPPLDEKSYTAEAHKDLLESILGVFGRSLDSVSVLIGDNCPTNKATVDLLDVNLLGCACHKLNLAIKRYLKDQPGVSDAIESVASLVSNANSLKAAAVLQELPELVAIRHNDTRWSSTYRMIKRFYEIEPELRQVPALEMPRHSELQRLRDLLPTLTQLDSVMVGLQKKGVTVGSARGTLNEVLKDYPELGHYLAQDASIVNNPALESAITKVLNNKTAEMSKREQAALTVFELPNTTPARCISWGAGRDFYAMLQERKRQRLEQLTSYQDLRFMLGTSSSVERHFSAAKCVMPDRRNWMTPVMFEALIFLKTNRSYWDSRLVAKAVKISHATALVE